MIDEDLNTPKNIGKGLLMCAFLASASMGMQQVQASGTDLSTPTLDALHNAGTTIPNSTTVYPESGYTLTETTDKTLDNVITKYEVKPVTRYYDMTTGAEVAPEARVAGTTYKEIQEKDLVPHYYQVNLKQTEYGAGVNSTTTTLTTQPVKDVEITSKYDTSQTRFDNTTDNSATNYSGDYINQTTNSQGGAIINNGTNAKLGNIKGNFIDNYASGSGGVYGGAIFNQGTIGNIIGDFIGNYVSSSDRYDNSTGGAIYNSGTIGNIIGDFIGNYVTSTSREAHGGAIANGYRSKIGNIAGDFIGNYALSTSSYALGGAINNDYNGTIGNITGDFIDNYVSSTSGVAKGGAIYNNDTIGNIIGDFIGNYASSTPGNAQGGAIYNEYRTIGNITGNFIGNYATSTSSEAQGGAIYNTDNAILGDITGDFTSNYASGTTASGGAIYNKAIMNDINGNFDGNYISATSGEGSGGAIYNSNIIGDLNGQFTNNSVSSDNNAYGGAIYNNSNIGVQVANGKAITSYTIWKLLLVDANGKVLKSCYEDTSWRLDELKNNNKLLDKLSFMDDTTTNEDEYNDRLSWGFIESTDDAIKAQFAPYLLENNLIDSSGIINTLFYNNSVKSTSGNANGGAIYNSGKIVGIKGDFIQNKATSESGVANGGAIYNENGTIGDITGDFIGNYAKSTSGVAKGGAIYTNKDLNFVANNRQSVFSGNYTESAGVKDDNAIYVDSNSAKLSFKLKNNGSFVMKDNIDGTTGYDVDIQGDDINNTNFYLQNDIRNADVTVGNTTLNTVNNMIHDYNFNSFALTSDTNMKVDVDLANAQMDRITANSYGTHSGNLIVNGMNLTSDMKQGTYEESILFADTGLKDNVVNGVTDLPDGTQTTLYTPIYKYTATYDNRADGGYFDFIRNGGGGNSNPSNAYNPAVLSSSVATQAGGYATQLETFNYAFQNSDTFMNTPYLDRVSMKYRNRYAVAIAGNDTDIGVFSPLYQREKNSGVWVKPYTAFESIPLKNGPKVSNITYGTLIGYDSNLKYIGHGFDRVITGYIGYNGSSQNFSGVDGYQNGGLLGTTISLYKKNFFNATTISVGASTGTNNTMYGTDNYTLLVGGIGNKTGYNFEYKEGRLILQPSLLVSYTFVNTFDYTNAAGVRIDNKPLNAIQVAPGIKLIGNTKHGWQPYIGVNMVWNIMGESHTKADGVNLPEMSIKPYVQYGVGVQKVFKDNFTAFGQAMVNNGGRNGISLTGGLKWALGKDETKAKEKVENPTSEKTVLSVPLPTKDSVTTAPVPQRKIIKQLTDSQRASLGAKAQNTTMTSNKGYFQEL